MNKLPVVTFDKVTLCKGCTYMPYSDECIGVRTSDGLTMISTVDPEYPCSYNKNGNLVICGCGQLLMDETTMPST